jgi:hypothetical protein
MQRCAFSVLLIKAGNNICLLATKLLIGNSDFSDFLRSHRQMPLLDKTDLGQVVIKNKRVNQKSASELR